MNLLKITLLSIFLFGCGNSDKGKEGKAYVTSQKGGISVIDLNSMEIIEEINVGATFPRGLDVPEASK